MSQESHESAAEAKSEDSAEVWAWAESEDSESWAYAGKTREEAIAYAHSEADFEALGDYGYISRGQRINVAEIARVMVDVDRLLEEMDEHDDLYGCFDEPVFELTDPRAEAEAALQDAVAAWAEKYVTAHGKFVCVGKSEKVPAPTEAQL